ncbi:AAA family ATPase [Halomonas sp. DWK9]|uniref:ATP-dependent nuclease n=1 Tax=Halomonas sp. DWK9 TaxID=3060155 RepID=UPI00287FE0F0|nr:AAA family ATPase [Halomonas sp. DWK9]
MKIEYIDVRKFRSIDQCRISLDTVNAIVGQNNSGKSALIRAMNAFFNPDVEESFFYQGKHNYTSSSMPKITIGFSNITGQEGVEEFGNDDLIDVQLVYQSSNKKLVFKYKSGGSFIAAPDRLIEAIGDSIAFVYIPPNRNPDQLKWEENTLIKELIEEYLKLETSRRDTLTPKFKSAAEYLEDGALNKISKEVEGYYSLRHKFNFSLNFDKKANFLSFLSGIQMHIKEAGVEHNLDDCGTGLQSLTIIAFHRVLAKLRHQNIVLGLEEPETNLHPQAQRELISSIKSSSDGNDISQVVITTHSTVLIDNIEHERISLVRKEPDESRGFKSVITKTSDSFFEVHGLEEFRYYQFHLYRNSDFFFANYVIFVESKNDAEVVKYLASRENVDLDLYGISVVNIDGVHNLAYPFHIVKELKIPYLAILDKDYFIPYLNDELEPSRNGEGLPRYRYEYKNGILLSDLISGQRNQSQILSKLRTNHSQAMDLLINHNIICMNYCLEMDLLCSNRAVAEMALHLNLTPQDSNRRFLLINRKKRIKNIGTILHVLRKLENKNLPNSFKRIKKQIVEISKRC